MLETDLGCANSPAESVGVGIRVESSLLSPVSFLFDGCNPLGLKGSQKRITLLYCALSFCHSSDEGTRHETRNLISNYGYK